MNRRNLILTAAAVLMFPVGLIAAPPKKAERPCKDCKKCGPECKCDCKKVCKCNPGCCGRPPAHGKPQGRPSRGRSYEGRPPHSRPSYGRPSRGRGYSHPSRGRTHGSPSPRSRGASTIISKFDKNKDGRLDEKERAEAKKYFTERYKNHRGNSK